MSRYIDADRLKDTLERASENMHPICGIKCVEIGAVIKAVDMFPTADVVEVRHGVWGFDGMGWTCSECGEYALTNKSKMQVHSVYCPHCGAKMDGERREDDGL